MNAPWHYQSGTFTAKDFLYRTHVDTRTGRPFVATRLRSKIDDVTYALSYGSQAGFIDAIHLFVTAALRGKAPDLLQRDALTDLERPS